MRTLAALLLCTLGSCCWFSPCAKPDEARRQGLVQTEARLADFSKAIGGYYGQRSQPVPTTFDEGTFFEVLAEAYPKLGQEDVREVKATYRVRARAVAGGYAVVLCDRKTGWKLMEDLSCTLDRVDLRTWEGSTQSACDFEADPAKLCR